MSNDITSYLLLAEQARWAKENGFDAKCAYYQPYFPDNREPQLFIVNTPGKAGIVNSSLHELAFTIPTFDQFFDWVEEKWGIRISVDRVKTETNVVYCFTIEGDGKSDLFIQEDLFPDKRTARLAAVDAIIQYVDNLKK